MEFRRVLFRSVQYLLITSTLPPLAIDQLKELQQYRLQRVLLGRGTSADQACRLVLGDAGLAGVINVQEPVVDAVLEQRQVRRRLNVVTDVAFIEVHCCTGPWRRAQSLLTRSSSQPPQLFQPFDLFLRSHAVEHPDALEDQILRLPVRLQGELGAGLGNGVLEVGGRRMLQPARLALDPVLRSEERRVGKECRYRWA